MPLGGDVALNALEAADDLVHEAAHLGEVPGARPEVVADPFLNRVGQAGFELGRRCRESFDRRSGAFEGCVERRGVGAAPRLDTYTGM